MIYVYSSLVTLRWTTQLTKLNVSPVLFLVSYSERYALNNFLIFLFIQTNITYHM